jgi:iron complex outermembrane receptor protein
VVARASAVLVDGVPLARLAEVTTDLGRYAMDAFGEVELYRGAVPIELGGAGAGGAVNLVTRLGRGARGERIRASIGAGSFGARHARLRYGDDHGRASSSLALGYQGATGDYTYFTDGGTPLNPGDDGYEVRRNNGFDQLDLAARAGAPDRARAGGLRLAWKRQGLPGSAAQPSREAARSTLDAIADARGGGRSILKNWPRATSCWCVPARRFPRTASSPTATATSINPRSPANRCRDRSLLAMMCSPAR